MSLLSRRCFVRNLAGILPVAFVPNSLAFAEPDGAATLGPSFRALRFLHTHTGERLEIEYFARGRYLDDALTTVNAFMRDFRTGDVHVIDRALLDLLHAVKQATESSQPFQVISAYRSPATNQMLRDRSEGVALGSLHMQGQAIDIRLGDVPLRKLRGAALDLKRGGVGYYPASNFVHVDTGRVRFW